MFLDEKKFQDLIEDRVWKYDITYLEAVVAYAEENMIDIEDLTGVISGALKSNIMKDAMDSGLMVKKSRLPI